jgi:hypothetical protein
VDSEKAARRLSGIVRASGPRGIEKQDAWGKLAEEGLDPKNRARGPIAKASGVRSKGGKYYPPKKMGPPKQSRRPRVSRKSSPAIKVTGEGVEIGDVMISVIGKTVTLISAQVKITVEPR